MGMLVFAASSWACLKIQKAQKKSQNQINQKKKTYFHWPLRFLDRVLKKSCYDDKFVKKKGYMCIARTDETSRLAFAVLRLLAVTTRDRVEVEDLDAKPRTVPKHPLRCYG